MWNFYGGMMSKALFKCLCLAGLILGLASRVLLAQATALIFLGDMHYDRLEDHHMPWLDDKPGDLRQVKEYSRITEAHWDDFMEVIRSRAVDSRYETLAILQAGDLSEGLAGSEEKAQQMAAACMAAIEDSHMPVPWILAKGNHDITGPGARVAFNEHYLPMIRQQTGNPGIRSASYSFDAGPARITCLDPWDRETDLLAFLKKELEASTALYKFVMVHEPVIPVTGRCWHLFREDEQKRVALLELIAKHQAIVLCGHLHRYAVVSRNTAFGPVVQVMAVSVVRDRSTLAPEQVITSYGAGLAGNQPGWQPESLDARKEMLRREAPLVTYFSQCELPGFAQITMDPDENQLHLAYYPAFGEKAYESISLTDLLGTSGQNKVFQNNLKQHVYE